VSLENPNEQGMAYRVPLWSGGRKEPFWAVLQLPVNLRHTDAAKIKAMLDTLIMDDQPPPAGLEETP